ncbi:MAG: hypothetical protein GC181_15030 [Bacteroidetes bacterium]|nr:hypothetical protein [Bacteroidota bacterium]
MAFEVQAEQEYNLVHITEELSAGEVIAISSQLSEGLLETPYVIVEIILPEELDSDTIEQWENLNELVLDNSGLMIFVGIRDTQQNDFEEKGLTTIPSLDEAIDYVFMDRLEKELDEDFSD